MKAPVRRCHGRCWTILSMPFDTVVHLAILKQSTHHSHWHFQVMQNGWFPVLSKDRVSRKARMVLEFALFATKARSCQETDRRLLKENTKRNGKSGCCLNS